MLKSISSFRIVFRLVLNHPNDKQLCERFHFSTSENFFSVLLMFSVFVVLFWCEMVEISGCLSFGFESSKRQTALWDDPLFNIRKFVFGSLCFLFLDYCSVVKCPVVCLFVFWFESSKQQTADGVDHFAAERRFRFICFGYVLMLCFVLIWWWR